MLSKVKIPRHFDFDNVIKMKQKNKENVTKPANL